MTAAIRRGAWAASSGFVLGLVEDLGKGGEGDRGSCVAVMRAKGAIDDRPFFLQLAAHPRLPAALARIAKLR